MKRVQASEDFVLIAYSSLNPGVRRDWEKSFSMTRKRRRSGVDFEQHYSDSVSA